MLKQSDGPLWDEYDLAMLDLDGVIYIGRDAVPGAAQQLEEAAAAGLHLAYVTNNAARPPAAVAAHLVDLGIPAKPEDVVTSAQAAARLLSEHVGPGAPVYVIGGTGLFEALTERDLHPVQSIADNPVAVVSGYHPDLRWEVVRDGSILVARGLPWVATNTDMTVPTAEGPGPGNGAIVEVVARFSGREPVVAGKPRPPLFHETQVRVGGEHPLVVGDRLDTDIEGAVNSGYDSLLVLTGVTGLPELVTASPAARPTYISSELAGLGRPHPVPEQTDTGFALGGWSAGVSDGTLAVRGDGSVDDWWRLVATTAWAELDARGTPVDVSGLLAPGSVAR